MLQRPTLFLSAARMQFSMQATRRIRSIKDSWWKDKDSP
jgi:hypothetical protein